MFLICCVLILKASHKFIEKNEPKNMKDSLNILSNLFLFVSLEILRFVGWGSKSFKDVDE